MPQPTPNADESHNDFIDRCMGDDTMVSDFDDTDQRLAVCESIWTDTRSDEPKGASKRPEGMQMRHVPSDLAQIRVHDGADGARSISGYGAVFYDGSEGTEFELWRGAVERIMPEAFDRAIEEKDDVRGLFNHDPSALLGRTSAGTMRLDKDKRGLLYDIDLSDTNVAQDVAKHIDRGDVSGSSFSFVVESEEWHEEGDVDVFEVRGVRLFDTGPVTYPAYTGTSAELRSGIATARESWDRWKHRDTKLTTEVEPTPEKKVRPDPEKLELEAFIERCRRDGQKHGGNSSAK